MLMRHTRAYSGSCLQIILVYLHPCHRDSLFCSRKSNKKSLKIFILGVQGHLRSSMLTFLKSSLPALVVISGMSVPICNRFYARPANSGKVTTFWGCLFLHPCAAALLSLGGRDLNC